MTTIYNPCLKKEKLVECGNIRQCEEFHTVQCSLELGIPCKFDFKYQNKQAIFQ